MKKVLGFIILLLGLSAGIVWADNVAILNPYTGKLDFVSNLTGTGTTWTDNGGTSITNDNLDVIGNLTVDGSLSAGSVLYVADGGNVSINDSALMLFDGPSGNDYIWSSTNRLRLAYGGYDMLWLDGDGATIDTDLSVSNLKYIGTIDTAAENTLEAVIDHNDLAGYVANQHTAWQDTSENLSTSGTAIIGNDATVNGVLYAKGGIEITGDTWTGDLTLTGALKGKVSVSSDTAATVTLTANDCLGGYRYNGDDDVIQYDLPDAAAGLSITIGNLLYANVISINPQAADIIIFDTTTLDAGDELDSPGAKSDTVTLLAVDGTYWKVVGKTGTWVDGGAD